MVWATALLSLVGLIAIPAWPMVQQLFGGETSADRFIPFLWCMSALMATSLLYLAGSVLAEHTLVYAIEQKQRERESTDQEDE
jgi:hypothetical protein